VNACEYADFPAGAVVLDFSNPIDYWLANISQRMVWDNRIACRFWIVNSLLYRAFERDGGTPSLRIDVREYRSDPAGCRARIASFLGTKQPPAQQVPDGFIRFAPELVDKIERDAEDIRAIYEGDPEFEAALRFDQWADAFLAEPGHRALLNDYRAFWNSTTHTNLDWVGPIEEEIVARVRATTGFVERPNRSRWFYHECHALSSDNWERPVSRLEHYLGRIEREIVLPEMPYYARVVLCYLENVAENHLKRAYSAIPQRQTDLFRRVTRPEYRKNFARWALEDMLVAAEKKIDQADEAIAKFC
jgi:hypothetical protein